MFKSLLLIQWNLRIKDRDFADNINTVVSFVERLSSRRRFKMYWETKLLRGNLVTFLDFDLCPL